MEPLQGRALSTEGRALSTEGRALSTEGRALSTQARALSATPLLRLDGIGRRFGATVAVEGVTLDVAPGSFVSLLGGSGSGKTTLLRLIAGFERPDAGRVLLDGGDMADLPPYRRPIGLVFQDGALFPHLSVSDNIAYGLRRDGVARAETARRVAEALELIGLGALARRKPAALSGGQRQRVALVRALVRRPRLVLLDEPLSALDAGLRERMGFELRALQRQTGAAFVMVTHDQEEALALSDRVALLRDGRLEQYDTPEALYERPTSRYSATFLGAANILETGGGFELRATAPAPAYALRPEWIRLLPEGAAPAFNGAAGSVRELAYRGEAWLAVVATDAGPLLRVVHDAEDGRPPGVGARVVVDWPEAALLPLAR